MNPLISFVLISYNQEEYIREAVQGAFSQTYSPLEIILSDDASTDRTFEIMEEMVAGYRGPHKVVLNRNSKNLGIGMHVKKAFSMARGDWIVGAAGDDISLPDRCQMVAKLHRKHPSAGGIGLGFQVMDSDGAILDVPLPIRYTSRLEVSCNNSHWMNALISDDYIVLGMSAAWRREVFSSFSMLDENSNQEDRILSVFATIRGKSLIFVPDIHVLYRRHDGNAWGIKDTSNIKEQELLVAKRAGTDILSISDLLSKLETACLENPHQKAHIDFARSQLRKHLEKRILLRDWWEFGTFKRLKVTFCDIQIRFDTSNLFRILRIMPLSFYIFVIKLLRLIKHHAI